MEVKFINKSKSYQLQVSLDKLFIQSLSNPERIALLFADRSYIDKRNSLIGLTFRGMCVTGNQLTFKMDKSVLLKILNKNFDRKDITYSYVTQYNNVIKCKNKQDLCQIIERN